MTERTTLALFARRADLSFMRPLLEQADPTLDIVTWPDPRCAEATVAVGWEAPEGIYAQLPKLKLVHALAAGVDNLVLGHDLGQARLCRVVDPGLADGMLQYVLWSVLYFHRQFGKVLVNQLRKAWDRLPPPTPASKFRVGLMGLGELGGHIAGALPRLGYTVTGWSRSPRKIEGVETFHGEAGLTPFLAGTDALVCLVPLTPETRGILSRRVFDALPEGAALIHVGRGEHLVEQDLRDALASGHLRGAVLDVFAQEPLPADNPLWDTPGVVVTPHMASMADWGVVAAQIAANVARLRRGEPLANEVDLSRGY
jgi:glyoxylate/hydroxypyruvate reductase A